MNGFVTDGWVAVSEGLVDNSPPGVGVKLMVLCGFVVAGEWYLRGGDGRPPANVTR